MNFNNTETQTEMQTQTETQTKVSRAMQIRMLRARKYTPKQIADTLGIDVQAVYNTKYQDKKKAAVDRAKARAAKALVQAKADAPKKIGRPKGSKTQWVRVRVSELNALRERVEQLEATLIRERGEALAVAAQQQIRYVEMPVPQPVRHLPFFTRLKLLFGVGGDA
jgi:DNA-binding CsgD family transcriptional regulator